MCFFHKWKSGLHPLDPQRNEYSVKRNGEDNYEHCLKCGNVREFYMGEDFHHHTFSPPENRVKEINKHTYSID
jgi:hypothetical protein